MAKRASGLTAPQVATLGTPGVFADGGGLHLQIGPSGTNSWVVRCSFAGRRRDMGLGPVADVFLAHARTLVLGRTDGRTDGRDRDASRGCSPGSTRVRQPTLTREPPRDRMGPRARDLVTKLPAGQLPRGCCCAGGVPNGLLVLSNASRSLVRLMPAPRVPSEARFRSTAPSRTVATPCATSGSSAPIPSCPMIPARRDNVPAAPVTRG